MNKKNTIAALLALAPLALQAQDHFTIHAGIGSSSTPAKAYLLYRNDHQNIIDSAPVTKGAFEFSGALPEPTLARLIVDHKGVGLDKTTAAADMTMMYLEKGTINLRAADSVKKAVITGSAINTAYAGYKSFIAVETEQLASLRRQQSAAYTRVPKDEAALKNIQQSIDEAYKQYEAKQYAYIKLHPNSYVSLMTLREVAGPIVDLPTIEPVFNSLSAQIRESRAGQEFKAVMNKKRALAIGQTAPAFTQNDVNGKPVSLASFKGSYVLIDFWASWCKPCRAENPHVVKVYQQFKDRNFTVISVSLDMPGKKADWLNAIKTDGLEWTNVSDLQFWNNEVAVLYGIKSVPQNFLLDKEGKIVAVNLRGDALGATLQKICAGENR